MDILKWISFPKNVEAYIKWKNDPVTQAVMQGVKDLSVPRRIADADPNKALQENGYQAGQHWTLNLLTNLELLSSAEEDLDADNRRLKYMVEFEGYTEEEAKRITERIEGNES